MAKTILGRKLGMTQVWSDDDRLIPVYRHRGRPLCGRHSVRTEKRDGYRAVQLAYGDMKESKVNKPQAGHFEKAGVAPKRHLAEVRLDEGEQYKPGQTDHRRHLRGRHARSRHRHQQG